MSTNTADNFNFKVMTMGKEAVDKRKPCQLNHLDLASLFHWIDSKNVEDRIKIELKKSASTYPQQALVHWQKNYTNHLAKAQEQVRELFQPSEFILDETETSLPPIPEEFQ